MSTEKASIIARLPAPPNKTGWPWTETGQAPTAVHRHDLPKITVVTPSYNQGQFIEATLRSVILQGYPHLEYLVMDGGSTDGSVDVIRRYEPWLARWVSEPDRGQSHAINKGLFQGTGQIFTWLNSDDMLLPGALWRVAEAYHRAPRAAGWVGACYLIKPDGRIIKTVVPRGLNRDTLADWFYGGYIFQPSCFFAAEAWRAVGGVDESLNYAMDFDLWLKLAGWGKFTAVDAPLSAAIIHDDAKTQAMRPEMHAETMYVQFRHGYQAAAEKRLKRLLDASANASGPAAKLRARLKRGWRRLTNRPRAARHVHVRSATNGKQS